MLRYFKWLKGFVKLCQKDMQTDRLKTKQNSQMSYCILCLFLPPEQPGEISSNGYESPCLWLHKSFSQINHNNLYFAETFNIFKNRLTL